MRAVKIELRGPKMNLRIDLSVAGYIAIAVTICSTVTYLVQILKF